METPLSTEFILSVCLSIHLPSIYPFIIYIHTSIIYLPTYSSIHPSTYILSLSTISIPSLYISVSIPLSLPNFVSPSLKSIKEPTSTYLAQPPDGNFAEQRHCSLTLASKENISYGCRAESFHSADHNQPSTIISQVLGTENVF